MRSPFQRIYPQDNRLIYDGGLNTKYPVTEILDNESPSAINVIHSNGAVETREGVTKLNTTSVGSFVCDGLYVRRDNTNAETMVAWFGGTAWQLTGSTFTTIASSQNIMTANVRVGSVQDENYIFFDNGGVIPYKWNGTAFTRHGVYPPTTTSIVASQSGGSLTGEYQYKITAVNSNSVESDVGPVTTTLTAAAATLRISSIPTFAASYGISARRVYRTAAGGTVFKRVALINDNTTTFYDDTIADASLGATAPTDNGVPPKWSVCVYHQGRLFMNDADNPNFIWYTELNNPYTVKTTNFQRVGDNTSDLVKGLSIYDNSLFIWCEKSIYLLYMPSTDPTTWILVKSKSAYGTKSPYCILPYENKQLFVAMNNDKISGFAALRGDTLEPESTLLTVSTAGSEYKSDRIEPDIFDIQSSYLGNISGVVFQNQAFIAVTFGSGNTQNNRVYVFDFSIMNLSKQQDEAWARWTGLSPSQFAIYNQSLYFGSSVADGFVQRCFNGTYSDNGSAIDSYFYTKEYTGYKDETSNTKDFRYAKVLVENLGAYNMGLAYVIDSDNSAGTVKSINLTPGGSLWGTMNWGIDSWGGGTLRKEEKVFLDGSRGSRIQFKFSNLNTVNQGFKVHGLSFAYNKKGYR